MKKTAPKAKRMRIVIRGKPGGYYWNMLGRNGKVMASAITLFRDRSACRLVVKTMIKHMGRAIIDESPEA